LADTEVLARDKAVTSPSLPRAYPLVPSVAAAEIGKQGSLR
jgi:hypothetical protein